MRIAVMFGPLCLSFRGSFDFASIRTDPRGLTGSEIGFVRIAQCLRDLGHHVTLYTNAAQDEWDGMPINPLSSIGVRGAPYDAAIAINEPDLLRNIRARVKVCEAWLNDWTFARPGFEGHVDLFVSPSHGHLEQMLTNESWRVVGVNSQHPKGAARYAPDPHKWAVIELGCDPERYERVTCDECNGVGCTHSPPCDADCCKCRCYGSGRITPQKIPGRVVYCSSPDRGLHLLLQEWPHIKRAVPHAHLRIFYRLRAWLDGFANLKYHPPIEPLRARALYVEECLRRMQGPEWGIEVLDSVSREQIEREMTQAEVLAYPCNTTSWSEGFSCTILEACAARACPIITDCDGLPSVYGDALPMFNVPSGLAGWRAAVISALQSPGYRDGINHDAHELASRLTWKHHAERLEQAIQCKLDGVTNKAQLAATIQHHPV